MPPRPVVSAKLLPFAFPYSPLGLSGLQRFAFLALSYPADLAHTWWSALPTFSFYDCKIVFEASVPVNLPSTSIAFFQSSLPRNIGPILIAMRDNNSMANGQCTQNSQTIYWYDDEKTIAPISNFPLSTFIGRNHLCDDTKTQGVPRCFVLWRFAGESNMRVGDDTCNFPPLCEFKSKFTVICYSDACG
jgi:hypothetical protein